MRSKEGDLYIKVIRNRGVYIVNQLINSLKETVLISLYKDIVLTNKQPIEEYILNIIETIAKDDLKYTL